MQGCTQDFGTFDPTGSGGGDPTSSSVGTSTATTSNTTTATTTTTTNVGPGGGGGAGPGGGGGGGDQGGGGGVPTDCVEAVDCDDDNVCTDDGCVEGLCSNEPVGDGPLEGDDETDCIDFSCDGGLLVETADDTEDPPDTSPPCDVTNCVAGVPVQVLADPGTSCGANPLVCDGAGLCSGCDGNPGNECGNATDCSDPSCNTGDGTCDPGFTSADPGDPTNGDCKTLVCPGDQAEGNVVNDDTDLPGDLACSDRGCSGGNITTPVRPEGMACLVGTGVCDGVGTAAANCKVCRDTAGGVADDAGCSGGTPICAEAGNGQCRVCLDDAVGNAQDTGCAADEVCDPAGTGTCVTCFGSGVGSVGCNGTEICDGGNCVVCTDDGDGVIDAGCGLQGAELDLACDESAAPVCVECQDPLDCEFGENPNGLDCNRAGGTECGCETSGNPDTDCVGAANGPICSGGGGTCSCTDPSQCSASQSGTLCLNLAIDRCGCMAAADCDHPQSAGPACVDGRCQ